MSYSLIGKFVCGEKITAICDFNFLKPLNDRAYASTFSDVEGTPVGNERIEDVTVEREGRFIGFYDSRLLDYFANKGLKYNKYESIDSFDKSYIIDNLDGKFDKESISMYEVNPTEEKRIRLYTLENIFNKGTWYTLQDISEGRKNIRRNFLEANTEVARLRQMKNSIDYFKLSEESKNSLLSELGYAEESLSEQKTQLEAIDKVYHIFDTIENHLYYTFKDEFGIRHYQMAADRKDNVKLFIEVT